MASTVFEGEKRPEQETGGEEGCRRWLVCGLISRLLAAWLSPHTPAFELELTADGGDGIRSRGSPLRAVHSTFIASD